VKISVNVLSSFANLTILVHVLRRGVFLSTIALEDLSVQVPRLGKDNNLNVSIRKLTLLVPFVALLLKLTASSSEERTNLGEFLQGRKCPCLHVNQSGRRSLTGRDNTSDAGELAYPLQSRFSTAFVSGFSYPFASF
jgi:hypothetical protein